MLEAKYNHLEVEKEKYEFWKSKGYFNSGDLSKEPFCIVIPPPNVTGKLHLGHAWDTAVQDAIIRYKRMDGFDALWIPGMDHAGIATQAKVDKKLLDLGIEPRSLSREEWLKKAWEWKEEYASSIRKQWAKLGLSLDYSKERFTLDEGLNNAVNKVFIDLYNKGLIYRDSKAINWDPSAKTALSNEEVIYKEEQGTMYYLKYYIEGTNEYIEVATTRPETLGSDTALVVNPNDFRYKNLVGKKVITPLRKESVPIITDEYIDINFGSGAMKCSAHAIEDVRILKENNIPIHECIDRNGLLNERCNEFKGLSRNEGRKQIVEKLKKENLIIKEEKHSHQVGHSERTDEVIEIMIMPQWFVKMDNLAKNVLENQKNKDTKVNFVPKRFEKILNHWMEIAHDWCISRQLWWGHQIPAWYKENQMHVGINSPGEGWVRDEDVLDTWFSSALWPFSTLGWPNKTEDLKRYYPTSVISPGYDIIFFWVARMIFQGLEFMGERPFKDCLIHGLIRDSKGRKMSKSLGNGVDPMDVIEEYGADALRFFLTTNSAPGQDLRYDTEKVKSSWNFINKLWNASRFVLMNAKDYKETFENLSISDKWILEKLNRTIKDVRKSMEKYELNNVGKILYDFVWDDFCDWYIELSKNTLNETTKTVLVTVLSNVLKMLHPLMPYVTEEIYSNICDDSIMVSAYPKVANYTYTSDYNNMIEIINLIKNVRKVKLDNNIGKEFYLSTNNKLILENETLICKMLKTEIKENDLAKEPVLFMGENVFVCYDSKEVLEREKDNLILKKEKLEVSINRRRTLLSNISYVNKAPINVVEADKKLLEQEEKELELINQKLK